MNKNSSRDSILTGNFCDIVNYFRAKDIDDVDRLAQRALTIIQRTSTSVQKQTGYEVNTDPFCAHDFASIALESINRTLTTYPFVRDPTEDPEADEEAVYAMAERFVEMAERLMPDPDIIAYVRNFEKQFGPFRVPTGGTESMGFPAGLMEESVAVHDLTHDLHDLSAFAPFDF